MKAITSPEETRFATFVEIEFDGKPFRLINTHLSVGDEDDRVSQLQAIIEWTRVNHIEDSFIVGDLNAVSTDDYHPADLDEINADRRLAGLPPSRSHAYCVLADAGYTDSYRSLLHIASKTDNGRNGDGSGYNDDARSSWRSFHTSRYKVRIDYVWLPPPISRSMESSSSFNSDMICVDAYEVCREGIGLLFEMGPLAADYPFPASDHYPVSVDISIQRPVGPL